MRTFIGIDFDEELKREIYALMQNLKSYTKKGRWDTIENIHLTLKFLGEIGPEKEKIDYEMKNLCATSRNFELGVGNMGIFDGVGSIRVLWLGLNGDISQLQSLHNEIDKTLAPLGFPEERRKFTPHITIGRDIIFESDFDQVRNTIGKIELAITNVERLFLFKSEQFRNRIIYSKVSEYILQKKIK